MFAQHETYAVPSNRLGAHDLVGEPVLEHAILVDSGLVGEGIGADDRLVGWHIDADAFRDETRDAGKLARLDIGVESEEGAARMERHHDFLERGVAGALTDAVDGTLGLSGASPH